MRKPLSIAGAIICFIHRASGSLISRQRHRPRATRAPTPRSIVPIGGDADAWFPPLGDYDTGGEPLDDERFEALMAVLDEALMARR